MFSKCFPDTQHLWYPAQWSLRLVAADLVEALEVVST